MKTLVSVLIVGLGSFFGGAGRYAVSLLFKNAGGSFPWATLLVNLAGCFLIGLLAGFFVRQGSGSSDWSLLLITGFCGGFTTFSTFARESLALLQDGNYALFGCYIALSLVAGLALVALGFALAK